MKSVFKAIRDSYYRALRGEENFWAVLLGWGVLLYVASFFIGFWAIKLPIILAVTFPNNDPRFLYYIHAVILNFIATSGLILVFIYPFIFAYSLIKISKRDVALFILAILIIVAFIYFHLVASQIFLGVSIGIFKSSFHYRQHFPAKLFSVLTIAGTTILFFYITFKTFKTLSTKK